MKIINVLALIISHRYLIRTHFKLGEICFINSQMSLYKLYHVECSQNPNIDATLDVAEKYVIIL